MNVTLKQGFRGNDVIALQQLLNLIGVKTAEDGSFGPATKQSVKTAQYKMQLDSNGIADYKFFKAIYEESKINIASIQNFAYAGLSDDQYNLEYQKKDILFLHHTAGGPNPYYVRDHFQKLRGTVATPYVIGGKGDKKFGDIYDGLCLQLFRHPSQWAPHIYMRANISVFGITKQGVAQNKAHETRMAKRSIGIEVCNYGYLEYINGEFYFMSRGRKIAKVKREDVQVYEGKGYRGKRFYQKYTEKQIETLRDVILKLSKLYSINLDKPKNGFDERWFDYSWDASRGNTNLVSHSSVRSKSDMHPQPELIKMLNTL